MRRAVICVIIGAAYLLASRGIIVIPAISPVAPAPTPLVIPVDVPVPALRPFAVQMTGEERDAMSLAYSTLAKAIAANPETDPAFPTTGSVRAAHRAAILAVWRGALGNQLGKYPGLREALESTLADRIGTDDIPLNPSKQSATVKAFNDISKSLQ